MVTSNRKFTNIEKTRDQKQKKDVYILLYLLLLFIYLLTAAGRLGNSDAGSMFAATKSLYTHRWVDVGPCRAEAHGNQCVPGVDGRMYSGYGLVPSVITYPAFAVGWRIAALLHKSPLLLAGMAVSFTNVFLTPLASVVLCVWLVEMGYSLRASVLTALMLGLATPLWFHGVKGFFSEPQFTLAFFTCCYLLYQSVNLKNAWLAGICFGIACGTRIYGLVLLPVLLWYLWRVVTRARISPSEGRAHVFGFSLSLSVCLAAIGWVNYVRFGSAFKTGYQLAFPSVGALLSTPLWHGLFGLIFNGEVGLLWYVPLVVLLPFAYKSFATKHHNEALLCLGVCLISVGFYAKYGAWHGGRSYGPRLLVPILPFLVMPLVTLMEHRADVPVSKVRALSWGIIALSLAIQLLGLTSSTARYYDLQSYYSAVGRTPWWGDSGILQNIAALPKLLSYHAERTSTAQAASNVPESPPQKSPNPEAYLSQFQNSINLLTFDFWLVKASALGLSRKVALLSATLLLGGMCILLARLLFLIRRANTEQVYQRAGA